MRQTEHRGGRSEAGLEAAKRVPTDRNTKRTFLKTGSAALARVAQAPRASAVGCQQVIRRGFVTPTQNGRSQGRSLLLGQDMGTTQDHRSKYGAVVGGWWRFVAVGGWWRLAVRGPWGLSLRAVIKLVLAGRRRFESLCRALPCAAPTSCVRGFQGHRTGHCPSANVQRHPWPPQPDPVYRCTAILHNRNSGRRGDIVTPKGGSAGRSDSQWASRAPEELREMVSARDCRGPAAQRLCPSTLRGPCQWATTGVPDVFCGATSERRGSGAQGANPGAPAAQRRCPSAPGGSSTQ